MGPECRQRVAVLEAVAQMVGLRDALYGGAWVPDEVDDLRVYRFTLWTREAGLRVEVSKVPGGTWVHLRGVESPKALRRALDTWARKMEVVHD
ncbi:hypothetical protein CSW50_02420 [Thermus scotoductus]|uniref:Uncharacterized protein n=1 Tax=Thermus scotoductus TaxID=37636 RepID=A0A430RAX9_THESC|nr:hypothetical protein CSW50_02420 [Thermus scotoductus]RTI10967.1 hypothetical protein CSW30_03140 [Thermus scotoductus]